MIRIKVCCISSIQEAKTAIQIGAAALGLVSHMPTGPGVIPEEEITRIAMSVPPPIATFLLTSSQNVDHIVAQQRRCRVNTIQLVDRMSQAALQELRRALPGISLVQVIHVCSPQAIDEARLFAPFVDALLLDSGNPALPVKELGGTGRIHDWNTSADIVSSVNVPVFLAGGLNPDNVREAVRAVKPFGLDLCSGVRTNGQLDEQKLRAFFKMAHDHSV